MDTSKKVLLLIFLLAFIPKNQAQQNVVSAGGNASGSGGSSSNSIGQMVYSSASGSSGSINQGVQHPFEIATLGTDNFPEISLQMVVYPNPSSSFINLAIENFTIENLEYNLFDTNGKEILNQKIENSITQISMENLSPAIYFLKVIDKGKLLKTFKIIKNQ